MAFVDHGEFEAMNMPIGHRTLRCDKDHFLAKMMVSTSTVCERLLLSIVVITRMRKMERGAVLAYYTCFIIPGTFAICL